ncbi:hypothetical protein F-VV10_0281 [Faustovirus]|nr:hypothetical protein F-VV10_0281 [Faustovirus]
MDSIARDNLLQILHYGDLSITSLVCVAWRNIGVYIQSQCDYLNCGLRHPKCMLKRPYDIACVAVRYDQPSILRWLVANNACDFDELKQFCGDRWDLYKCVYAYLYGKPRIMATIPQTDREFTRACNAGRWILPPFNMTISALPLRGLAASHALKYNPDAKFVIFGKNERRLSSITRYRNDVSLAFHNHDFEAVKAAVTSVDTSPRARTRPGRNSSGKPTLYIAALGDHTNICDDLYHCNCIAMCEWIINNAVLESGCHYQFGTLKYRMRMLGIYV